MRIFFKSVLPLIAIAFLASCNNNGFNGSSANSPRVDPAPTPSGIPQQNDSLQNPQSGTNNGNGPQTVSKGTTVVGSSGAQGGGSTGSDVISVSGDTAVSIQSGNIAIDGAGVITFDPQTGLISGQNTTSSGDSGEAYSKVQTFTVTLADGSQNQVSGALYNTAGLSLMSNWTPACAQMTIGPPQYQQSGRTIPPKQNTVTPSGFSSGPIQWHYDDSGVDRPGAVLFSVTITIHSQC